MRHKAVRDAVGDLARNHQVHLSGYKIIIAKMPATTTKLQRINNERIFVQIVEE